MSRDNDEISASGKGGNSSSEAFILFGNGVGNLFGLLARFLAPSKGSIWAMFVPGGFAVLVATVMMAVAEYVSVFLIERCGDIERENARADFAPSNLRPARMMEIFSQL